MYFLCTYITTIERKRKYAYEAGVQYRCREGFDYGGGMVMESTVLYSSILNPFLKRKGTGLAKKEVETL
jgi:hypothetical protein